MNPRNDVRTVLVLAMAIPLGITGEWAYSRTGAPLPALLRDLAVGWAFVAAGLVAWRRQPGVRIGTLMAAEGVSWFLANFQGSGVPALFVLGVWLGALNEAVLVHLVLAFPDGRLSSRAERVVVTTAYVLALAGGLAYVAVNGTAYDPYRCAGCTAGIPVPAVGDRMAVVASHAGEALGTLLALATVVLVAGRWLRSSQLERRTLAPAWLSLGTCALLVVSHGWDASPVEPPATAAAVFVWASDVLELAVPLGFLAVAIRMRMARAAVGELVLRLGSNLSPAALGEPLRRLVGDPTLEVGVWSDSSGAYRDGADRPLFLAAGGEARAVTRIDRDGRPVAVILHDRALSREQRLLEAVAAAARLCTELRPVAAELEAVRESRARIVAEAVAERRRLERDLHDGAQQRFALLALTLGSALQQLSQRPDAAGLQATLARAADELREGLGELRELAAGIHPAVLTERGLAAAVESLAARMPVPVEVTAPNGRWPAAVEANAYFVVSEALTNAVKHARATTMRVRVADAGGTLVVEVADDGAGGADPERGSGLRGIADRLLAAGGTLRVESPAGEGTCIRAVLPCE
ncbi:MAG TPA: sensor histidine kinase [Terriglobales bacterium]|nr:sensor histidine kinase [Terriglobales bacterium]